MTPTHPPLKRHPALQPFSRDHYVGLVQAQHLLKAADGTDANRRRAVKEFLDAWKTDVVVHLDEEERLLPELLDEPAAQRLMREHEHLRRLAVEANERRRQINPGAEWVRHLGQTLNDHIRWEERELFTVIQQEAEEAELEALARQTRVMEQGRRRT